MCRAKQIISDAVLKASEIWSEIADASTPSEFASSDFVAVSFRNRLGAIRRGRMLY